MFYQKGLVCRGSAPPSPNGSFVGAIHELPPKFVGAGLAPALKGFNCRGTAPPCPDWAAARAALTFFSFWAQHAEPLHFL